jgi:hypothetical protein
LLWKHDERPNPAVRRFDDRIYAAAVSPESVRIMADVGAGILINPQKDWTRSPRTCATTGSSSAS